MDYLNHLNQIISDKREVVEREESSRDDPSRSKKKEQKLLHEMRYIEMIVEYQIKTEIHMQNMNLTLMTHTKVF